MRFVDRKVGSVLVAKVLDARIGAEVALSFKNQMLGYIDGNSAIVLDLGAVTFIDSSGLGAIVSSLKAAGRKSDLVICGARDTVQSMFKLTRMDKVFRMFPTSEEAVSALS